MNRYPRDPPLTFPQWRRLYRNRHGHDPPPRLENLKRLNRASVRKRKSEAENDRRNHRDG